jgi:hypothetical protein
MGRSRVISRRELLSGITLSYTIVCVDCPRVSAEVSYNYTTKAIKFTRIHYKGK